MSLAITLALSGSVISSQAIAEEDETAVKNENVEKIAVVGSRAAVIAFQGGGINDCAQGPDISVIPGSALKQVEVLRDGAAAQYGSDAIAGVMNFVLKDNSEGGSITVTQGEYYEGDGATTTV